MENNINNINKKSGDSDKDFTDLITPEFQGSESETPTDNSATEFVVLRRDCVAQMVPAGTRMILQRGTEVKITQSFGDSFTVEVFGNLARIEGIDSDALGKDDHTVKIECADDASIDEKVLAAIRTVFDPEIPVNIYDLGLVYDIKTSALKSDAEMFNVVVSMTLTSPTCAMGPTIIADVEKRVKTFPEVDNIEVDLVFDPPWDKSMMSEAAQLELGLF